MNLFELIALVLGAVVGVRAVMGRSWDLLLLAIAVIVLALTGEIDTRIIT